MGRASLVQAIASVAAQGRDDAEVIVVDASGHLQLPVVDGVPVRVVGNGQQLHRSVAASMGLAAVRTRWAGFLDDDDLLLPGHLDKLAAALEATPEAVLAHSGVEVVRRASSRIELRSLPELAAADTEPVAEPGTAGDPGAPEAVEPVLLTFDAPFDPWELLLGNRMPIHAALFDARRAQAAGADFDRSLDIYEDWDFWLQLRQLGPFVHAPGVTARYLIGDDASDVHGVQFGEEPYWRVWSKWWPRAPRDWWVGAFHAGARLGPVGRELEGTRGQLSEALQGQQQEHARLLSTLDELAALHGTLAERLQALAEAQSRGDRLQAELEAAQAGRDAAQAELGQVQGRLAETLDALQQTRAALESTQSSLGEAREGLALTQQALADSERQLALQRIESQRLGEELQALRQSRFWRMTAPLRALVDRLRGLRGWAARARRSGPFRTLLHSPRARLQYQRWIREVESPYRGRAERPRAKVLFSVLMPVYNPRLPLLDAAIESVRAQDHADWELCLADDASTDPAVRGHLRAWAAREPRLRCVERPSNGHISAASNSALALAQGDWVVLLDQDDLLAPRALSELAAALADFPDAGILYSDEDKVDEQGRRFEPYFKPAFNIELLRGQNMISHLGAYRRSLVEGVGGFREGFEGSQDHDLALRCAERLAPAQVVHVPHVLYHWRAASGSTAAGAQHKPYAATAALRAVQEHLDRTAPGSVAEPLPASSFLRTRLAPPRSLPAVRVVSIVPSVDAADDWVRQLRESAGPAEFDVQCLAAGNGEGGAGLARQIVAGLQSEAPLLLLLRHGLVPARPGWLAELIGHLMQPGVGVVGARVESPDGRLVDGCLIGGPQVAWQGARRSQHGHFGRALLSQAVSAVGPSVLLMRREAARQLQAEDGTLDLPGDGVAASWQLCQRLRQRGWRVVWAPGAVFVEGPMAVPAADVPPAQGDAAMADDPAGHPGLRWVGGALVLRREAADLRPRPGF